MRSPLWSGSLEVRGVSLESLRVAANPCVSLECSLHQKIQEESLPRMQLEFSMSREAAQGRNPDCGRRRVWEMLMVLFWS